MNEERILDDLFPIRTFDEKCIVDICVDNVVEERVGSVVEARLCPPRALTRDSVHIPSTPEIIR